MIKYDKDPNSINGFFFYLWALDRGKDSNYCMFVKRFTKKDNFLFRNKYGKLPIEIQIPDELWMLNEFLKEKFLKDKEAFYEQFNNIKPKLLYPPKEEE